MSIVHDGIDTDLALLLDEVAATIEPHGDIDAVLAGTPVMPVTARGGVARRPLRHTMVAAAAALLVTAGGAAAYQTIDDDGDALVSSDVTTVDAVPGVTKPADPAPVTSTPDPAASPASSATTGASTSTLTAKLGESAWTATPPTQQILGTAPVGAEVTVTGPYGSTSTSADASGRWSAAVDLGMAMPGEKIRLVVTAAGVDRSVGLTVQIPGTPTTEPKPTEPQPTVPKPTVPDSAEPAADTTVPKSTTDTGKTSTFTAVLGWTEGTGSPLKVGLWGQSDPGSTVTVSSDRGSGSVVATAAGTWEIVVELRNVPPGGKVGLRVSSTASAKVHDFTAKAPHAEPVPVSKPFTAALGHADLGATPMKQYFTGTGDAGSTIRVASDYGVVETVVGKEGYWEAKLKVEVPFGVTVGVRVTSSASSSFYDFSLQRPAAPAHEFTAKAAYTDCSDPIPYNEYSGMAAPGALITIESPYGGGQVTAGPDGTWWARVEFPSAPLDQPFTVKVRSSQGGSKYEFPFVRLAPQ